MDQATEVKIRFEDVPLSKAGPKVEGLRERLLDLSPELEARIEKDDPVFASRAQASVRPTGQLAASRGTQEVRTFHHSTDATDNTKPQTMRFPGRVTELRA